MDLTFQVPMQYFSLQHRSLLPSPVTSTAGHRFCFGSALHSFWGYFSTLLQQHICHLQISEFIFQCHIFLPFHTLHGVLKARILKQFAIPSPVNHVLSELSTMTHPSCVALQGMAHHSTELDTAVIQVIGLVSFL